MIGTPVEDLETPAIVIDLDIMERNLEAAASYARQHSLRLRPHTKTHKIPALGKRQLDLGAAGLTVAKVGEAEVMTRSGTPDLLVAFPVIGASKVARLLAVARERNVTVSLDSIEAANGLSEGAVAAGMEIGVLAEFDAGLHRVGIRPELLFELVEAIDRLPGLRLEGIAFYPGHIKKLDETASQEIAEAGRLLDQVLNRLRERFPIGIVSGGSTPALWRSHEFPGLNEIRPGTYIFNDLNTVLSGACTFEDCAARIHTTIISTAVPGQIVLDGGSKTFSSDRPSAADEVIYGQLDGYPDAKLFRLNEEHGWVRIPDNSQFRVGQRITVLPVHICVAVNLQDQVYGVRGGRVEEVWRVEARGKVQ
jgi:D-serine deaminase-like pyridoxal phosphate-dependent protein